MPVFAAFAFVLFFVFTRYQPLVTRHGQRRLAFGVFVVTALIGVALEWMQRTLPGRWSDPWDVMWSTMGSLAGVLCALVVAGITGRMLRSAANPPASQQTTVHGV
jgi:VanZ family protein